jgi:hypothetical protein
MLTITKSHLRRLTATILIGCVILLPTFIGRVLAQSDRPSAATATLSTASL